MAVGVEIERLIIRLVGKGEEYENMLKRAEQQTKTYVDKAGRLHDKLTGRFVGNVLKMKLSLKTLGRGMIIAGETMRRAGRTMSLAVTAPMLIVGGLAVRSFAKFDSAMTQSLAIMTATTDQMEQMRQTAINLSFSGDTLQGPRDLGEAYFFLASAGKDAEQSMSLLPQVAAFATAGMFDMAQATDLLTDAQSALGLSVKDVAQDALNMGRVSDVLVKANTLANASVEQFAIALTSKAGASLKAFNKDIEEGVAVLAALADQGVKAQLAGNSLDRMIRLLSKTSLDNAKAHKELGFRVFDSAGKMRNLGDVVRNLEDILHGMSDQTKVATLDMLGFEARVQQVILPLLGTSDAIKKYERELRKAKGITDEVSRKQMKSFSGQMKILKNQISVVAIEIGQALAPALLRIGSMVKGAVDSWRSWSSTTKGITIAIAALVVGLGPLLLVLGALSWALGQLTIALGAVAASAVLTKAALLGVGAAVVVIAIIAVRAALEDVNIQLKESEERLGRLTKKRWDDVAAMKEGAEKETRIAKTRADLFADRLRAEEELQKVTTKLDESVGGFLFQRGGPTRGIVDFLTNMLSGPTEIQLAETAVEEAKKAIDEFAKTGLGKKELPEIEATLSEGIQEAIENAWLSGRQVLVRRLGDLAGVMPTKGELTITSGLESMVQGARDSFSILGNIASSTFDEIAANAKEAWRKAEQANLDSMRTQKKQMQEGLKVTEQFLNPLEKYVKREKELNKLLDVGAIDQETFNRALKGADAELARLQEKGRIKIEFNFAGIGVTEAGSAERVIRGMRSQMAQAISPTGPTGIATVSPGDVLDARARVDATTGKEAPQQKIISSLERLIEIAEERLAQEEEKKGVSLEAAAFD